MAPLDGKARAALPDSAFAYIDAKRRRRLPINDPAHTRNALARFEQTEFESDAARERARLRLLRAAKKFGISTLGFFDGQLRTERRQGQREASEARIARLPSGIVTFLLADIEGSTPLARQLGDAWPGLLGDLWKEVRRNIRSSGGDEVDIRGDEYFAVFRRVPDALMAAANVQRGILKHAWPPGQTVRVRIGLHTGKPTIADAAYVGIEVHTVARVCSAGHGGQVLLSSATHAALAEAMPAGMTARELGRYRLAGLPEPEMLYQLEALGLATEFPKLRSKTALTRSRRMPDLVHIIGREEGSATRARGGFK
ncbi:MAG TPA: adenylate/guanylate cyclase domain-containing protein [Candidatus Dormibacteraeota bacterium]|nr:adenylate/guanylate cyclase domain-containing protein [Candidatus Dormibacteraeota bacterium]